MYDGVSAAEFAKAGRDLAAAYQRAIRTPGVQAMIRASYRARLAELPWWRWRERRELTRKYQMLTEPVENPSAELPVGRDWSASA